MAALRRFLDDHGVVHLESNLSMSSVPVAQCVDVGGVEDVTDVWPLRQISYVSPTCLWCASWHSR